MRMDENFVYICLLHKGVGIKPGDLVVLEELVLEVKNPIKKTIMGQYITSQYSEERFFSSGEESSKWHDRMRVALIRFLNP